jgi:hypothetical protein
MKQVIKLWSVSSASFHGHLCDGFCREGTVEENKQRRKKEEMKENGC